MGIKNLQICTKNPLDDRSTDKSKLRGRLFPLYKLSSWECKMGTIYSNAWYICIQKGSKELIIPGNYFQLYYPIFYPQHKGWE